MAGYPDPFGNRGYGGGVGGDDILSVVPDIMEAGRRRASMLDRDPGESSLMDDILDYGSRGVHAAGEVLGAQKSAVDALARGGARNIFGLDVPDDMTTGQMVREGLGLSNEAAAGQEGNDTYARRAAGTLIGFGTDIATDPLTWELGGASAAATAGREGLAALNAGKLVTPEAIAAANEAIRVGKIAEPVGRAAAAAFLPGMIAGAGDVAGRAGDHFQREGFTPEAMEESIQAILQAGFAVASGLHAAHTPDTWARTPEVMKELPAPPSRAALPAGGPDPDFIDAEFKVIPQDRLPPGSRAALPEGYEDAIVRPQGVLEPGAPPPAADRMLEAGPDQPLQLQPGQLDRSGLTADQLSFLESLAREKQQAAVQADQIPAIGRSVEEALDRPAGEPRLTGEPAPADVTALPGGDMVNLSPASRAAAGPVAPRAGFFQALEPGEREARIAQLARSGELTIKRLVDGLGVSPSQAKKIVIEQRERAAALEAAQPPPGPVEPPASGGEPPPAAPAAAAQPLQITEGGADAVATPQEVVAPGDAGAAPDAAPALSAPPAKPGKFVAPEGQELQRLRDYVHGEIGAHLERQPEFMNQDHEFGAAGDHEIYNPNSTLQEAGRRGTEKATPEELVAAFREKHGTEPKMGRLLNGTLFEHLKGQFGRPLRTAEFMDAIRKGKGATYERIVEAFREMEQNAPSEQDRRQGLEKRSGQDQRPVAEAGRRTGGRRIGDVQAMAAKHNLPADNPLVLENAANETKAYTDKLTGLRNQAYHEEEAPNRGGHASLDMAGLKKVNDTFGHVMGNVFLQDVAHTLKEVADRHGVELARIGGDEFGVLADTPEQAKAAAEEMKAVARSREVLAVKDGRVVATIPGPRVDYGYGATYPEADGHLIRYRERVEELPPEHPDHRPARDAKHAEEIQARILAKRNRGLAEDAAAGVRDSPERGAGSSEAPVAEPAAPPPAEEAAPAPAPSAPRVGELTPDHYRSEIEEALQHGDREDVLAAYRDERDGLSMDYLDPRAPGYKEKLQQRLDRIREDGGGQAAVGSFLEHQRSISEELASVRERGGDITERLAGRKRDARALTEALREIENPAPKPETDTVEVGNPEEGLSIKAEQQRLVPRDEMKGSTPQFEVPNQTLKLEMQGKGSDRQQALTIPGPPKEAEIVDRKALLDQARALREKARTTNAKDGGQALATRAAKLEDLALEGGNPSGREMTVFQGDRAEYTGERALQGEGYEIRMLEGHNSGQTFGTYDPPGGGPRFGKRTVVRGEDGKRVEVFEGGPPPRVNTDANAPKDVTPKEPAALKEAPLAEAADARAPGDAESGGGAPAEKAEVAPPVEEPVEPAPKAGKRAKLKSAAEAARGRLKKGGKATAHDLVSAAAKGAEVWKDAVTIAADLIADAPKLAENLKAFSRAVQRELGTVARGLGKMTQPLWEAAKKKANEFVDEVIVPSFGPESGSGSFATTPGTTRATGQRPSGFSIPEEKFLEKTERIVQDRLSRLRVREANVKAEGGTERFVKRVADALSPKIESRFADVDHTIVRPLIDYMSKHGLKLEDVDDYLYAKHAPWRNRVIKARDPNMSNGSGMSDAKAALILSKFQRDGKTAKLDGAAQFIRQARDAQFRVLRDGGLISAKQEKQWRQAMGPDYVPLRTIDPIEATYGPGTGRGFDVRGKETQSATGRGSKADSPTMFMLQQLHRAIVRAEKNKVDQRFASWVKENGLFEMDKAHTRRTLDSKGNVVNVADPQAIQNDYHYKVDGVTHRISIAEKDPLLDRAMKNLSAEETGQMVHRVGILTRLFSKLATSWNTEFLATNFARDVQTALGYASAEKGGKVAASMTKNIPQAITAMYREIRNPGGTSAWAQSAREFKKNGGSVGWYNVKDIPELEREFTGNVARGGPGTVKAAQRAVHGVISWIGDANQAVENGTRLAYFKALRDAGLTAEQAADAARNLTIDFNKKGEMGPAMNALYAFFNANIQGGKRLIEVGKTPRGAAVFAGIAALGFAADQANRAASSDSDKDGTNDYDAIPDYVKQRNIVIMRGDGKKPFLFPMPYGLNVLYTAGRQASAALSGATKPAEAALNVVGSLANAFNPLGGEADLIQTLSPTFLDPFVQDVENKSFTGRPIRPEAFPGSAKKPNSEMYFKNISPVSRWIAEKMNTATGGDKVTPGYVDVSPETLEHYYGALTGGLGKFVGNTAATVADVAAGKDAQVRNEPFVRRFVYDESPGAQGMKYRTNIENYDQVVERAKTYLREGQREKLSSLPNGLLRAIPKIRAIERELSRVKKLPDSDTREKVLDSLYRQGNRVFAEAEK